MRPGLALELNGTVKIVEKQPGWKRAKKLTLEPELVLACVRYVLELALKASEQQDP